MRKLYLLGLITFFSCSYSYSQTAFSRISRGYFRSDPSASDFSSFMAHLLHDPTLTDTVMKKRTDTSLFYFTGTYKTHNPFFFKPKKVEVVLGEAKVVINDSLRTDTLYIYELVATTKASEQGIKDIKKEFDRIHRRFKGQFFNTSFTESDTASKVKWASYNFFHALCYIAPFSVTWVGPDEKNEMSLFLTMRFDINANQAILPIPLNAL